MRYEVVYIPQKRKNSDHNPPGLHRMNDDSVSPIAFMKNPRAYCHNINYTKPGLFRTGNVPFIFWTRRTSRNQYLTISQPERPSLIQRSSLGMTEMSEEGGSSIQSGGTWIFRIKKEKTDIYHLDEGGCLENVTSGFI